MALRSVICLLGAVMLCDAILDPQSEFRRRQFQPEHRHGFSPLERFVRKSTQDSLEMDILVTAGIDPCRMNDSKIILTTQGSSDSQVIGHLSDSMLFGLRGFDDFRQRIFPKHVRTRLAFQFLEGSSTVTLIGKESFQTNFILTNVIIDIDSQLEFEDRHVKLSKTKLVGPMKPRVLIQPSEPIFRHFLKPVAKSFIHSARNCIMKNFIPAFENGVNHALSSKNISEVIENLQSQPAIMHKHFTKSIDTATPKIIEFMKDLDLPLIQVNLVNDDIQYNFTDGRVIEFSEPTLYYVNRDPQNNTYNLQIFIKDITILYKLQQQPVPRKFINIQYLLQVSLNFTCSCFSMSFT